MFQRFFWLCIRPITKFLEHRRRQRRLKQLRERDPFIY